MDQDAGAQHADAHPQLVLVCCFGLAGVAPAPRRGKMDKAFSALRQARAGVPKKPDPSLL
jgi:hypothetical protein